MLDEPGLAESSTERASLDDPERRALRQAGHSPCQSKYNESTYEKGMTYYQPQA